VEVTGRAQEHKNTGAQEHKSTGAQKHRSTGAQEHKNTGAREHRGGGRPKAGDFVKVRLTGASGYLLRGELSV